MNWAYLLIFNDEVGTRQEVLDFLDSVKEITYWYVCMPHAVFFTSTLTAGGISDLFKQRFGTDKGQRFFITEVHKDRQGWLPKQVWHMLKNPDDPRLKGAA